MIRASYRAARRAAGPWMLGLSSFALVACGGGGGGEGPPVTLGGTVQGQRPGTELQLQVSSYNQALISTSYASSTFIFTRTFTPGTNYSITVVKHPPGQLCSIPTGASGQLNASSTAVVITCSHTLLNDTGIALGVDGAAGRDAEATRLAKTGAGALGFDFTRLCASGDVAGGAAPGYGCTATTAFPANAWACTRDNTTGLVWQRTDVAGDAASTVAQCGVAATDWRKPSAHELVSLVHAGRSGAAAIDTDYFSGTPQAVYITGESYRDGGTGTWAVDFINQGLAGKYSLSAASARLRWVAGTARLGNAAVSLTRSAVGSTHVLIDNHREQMWLVPTSTATVSHSQAVDGVAAVNAARPGGFGDWRLPNRHELDALVLRSASGPALDVAVYGSDAQRAAFSQLFWSASPVVPSSGAATLAWAVDFSFGDITPLLQTGAARVIYVRDRVADAAP